MILLLMLKDMRYNIDRGGYMKKKIIAIIIIIIILVIGSLLAVKFLNKEEDSSLKNLQ